MKTGVILLLLLAVMWGALGWAMVTGWEETPPPTAPSPVHGAHAAMVVGGGVMARDAGMWQPGLWLGLGTIGLLVFCIGLGIGFGSGDRALCVCLALGCVLYGGVYVGLMRAWAAYAAGDEAMIGPFPAAAGWMVFGLWSVPTVFIALYVLGFRRWVVREVDERRFEALLSRNETGERGGG